MSEAAASSSNGEMHDAGQDEKPRKLSFSMPGGSLRSRSGKFSGEHQKRASSTRKQSWTGVLEGPAAVASKVLHRTDDEGSLTPRAFKTQMEEKLDRVKLLQAHSSQHDMAVFARDWLLALNTLLSLVATCVFFELNWKPTPDWEPPPPRWTTALGVDVDGATEAPGEIIETDSVMALKWCISALTLLLIVQVFEYQHFQYLIHHAVESAELNRRVRFHLTHEFRLAVRESLLWVWHQPPFLPKEYDSLSLLLWLRILLLLRLLRGFSDVYRKREQIVRACMAQDRPVPPFDWEFIGKSMFQQHPFKLLFFFSACIIIIPAHVMYVAERAEPTTAFTYKDSIWVTSVTVTTLGYGDMVPQTVLGRFASFVGAVLGLLLSSVAVAVLTNLMAPASYQQRAIEYLWIANAHAAEKKAVVKFVQAMWLHKVALKKQARAREAAREEAERWRLQAEAEAQRRAADEGEGEAGQGSPDSGATCSPNGKSSPSRSMSRFSRSGSAAGGSFELPKRELTRGVGKSGSATLKAMGAASIPYTKAMIKASLELRRLNKERIQYEHKVNFTDPTIRSIELNVGKALTRLDALQAQMLVLAKNQSELYGMATPRAQANGGGGRSAEGVGGGGGGRNGAGAGVAQAPKERHRASVALEPTDATLAASPGASTSAQGVEGEYAVDDQPWSC